MQSTCCSPFGSKEVKARFEGACKPLHGSGALGTSTKCPQPLERSAACGPVAPRRNLPLPLLGRLQAAWLAHGAHALHLRRLFLMGGALPFPFWTPSWLSLTATRSGASLSHLKTLDGAARTGLTFTTDHCCQEQALARSSRGGRAEEEAEEKKAGKKG